MYLIRLARSVAPLPTVQRELSQGIGWSRQVLRNVDIGAALSPP